MSKLKLTLRERLLVRIGLGDSAISRVERGLVLPKKTIRAEIDSLIADGIITIRRSLGGRYRYYSLTEDGKRDRRTVLDKISKHREPAIMPRSQALAESRTIKNESKSQIGITNEELDSGVYDA